MTLNNIQEENQQTGGIYKLQPLRKFKTKRIRGNIHHQFDVTACKDTNQISPTQLPDIDLVVTMKAEPHFGIIPTPSTSHNVDETV